MIEHELDRQNSILYLRPKSALDEADFAALAKTVDPFIEETGGLAGLIIEVAAFPGWEGLGAMAAHFRFVRDHHRKIRKVALITDSALGSVGEHMASHFVAAEIRHFRAGEIDVAKRWIAGQK
ncbi:MAG TPA: STAS/SEC14 domain-containing protein [Dongiaceae bacterium]|nr:STAS/SEC14 domain-containing protein [Dongiaceae bacterium]